MLVLALSVAGCAAYFSIFGLSQLFAGGSTGVISMAIVLELAKIFVTTYLHRYWSRIAKGMKIYGITAIAVLMLITSAGIYGFLSNAYQQTSNRLEIHEGELSILDAKKELFEKGIEDNSKIITTKNKRIDQLGNLRSNQETRLDSAKSNRARGDVRGDITTATKEIQKLTTDIDELNSKNSSLADSVGKYNSAALELKANSSVAAEIGPLKYISQLTGIPMARVVNYLIMLIMFVFDPLAVALILMTNRMFELEGGESPVIILPTPDKPKDIPIIEPVVESIPTDDGVSDGVNDATKTEEVSDTVSEPINDAVSDIVSEPVIESNRIISYQIESEPEVIEEPIQEMVILPPPIRQPVIPNGRVELKDIKEIKDRGYSVDVPQPKQNNSIERIGSNKIVKNGDNNKVYFKRK